MSRDDFQIIISDNKSRIEVLPTNSPFTRIIIWKRKGRVESCVYLTAKTPCNHIYTIGIRDIGIIDDDDFNTCVNNTESLYSIIGCVYDTYMSRHKSAMSAKYTTIDNERLYDIEDPFNMILDIQNYDGPRKDIIRIIYSTKDCFARDMLGIDGSKEFNRSAYYIYGSIMCGVTPKPLTKNANN